MNFQQATMIKHANVYKIEQTPNLATPYSRIDGCLQKETPYRKALTANDFFFLKNQQKYFLQVI